MKGKGLTFQIVIGKWSKVELNFDKQLWRLCLGWISFSMIFLDMEVLFTEIMKENKSLRIETTKK